MELGSSGIFTITFKFEEHAMTSDVILRVLRTPGKFDSDAGRVDGPLHNEVSTVTSAETRLQRQAGKMRGYM